MEQWRRWGLTPEEWGSCVAAARELAASSRGARTPSAERLAAEMAVAKEAEREADAARGGPFRRIVPLDVDG